MAETGNDTALAAVAAIEEAVQAELDNPMGDEHSMRMVLETYNTVPASLRAGVWKVLMGVKTKPDVLSPQQVQVPDHDDTPLVVDCREQAERFVAASDQRKSMAQSMATVLVALCRARGVEYSSSLGYAEQLAPFAALSLSPGDMYNCFYALMSKFALTSAAPDSDTFHLFRLLLLYHDAELCNFLDSLRVTPDRFAQTWFRSLFVHTCGPEVVLPLWDVYLRAGDPFFVFYLGLVMLINARDYVFSLADDVDGLVRVLSTMPRELTVADIPDMCELSFHYANVTPPAVRATYLGELFGFRTRRGGAGTRGAGTGALTSTSLDPFSSLCVRVPVADLLHSAVGGGGGGGGGDGSAATAAAAAGARHFVIDTRALIEYDASHLASAWHLDGQLLLDNPVLFEEEVTRLVAALDATLKHPCFMGSGREGDEQVLHMVVSHFLKRRQNHVSIARGGFEALRDYVENDPAAAGARLETNASAAVAAAAAANGASDGAASGSSSVASTAISPQSRLSDKLSASWSSWRTSLREQTARATQAARETSARLKERSERYREQLKERSERWGMSPGGGGEREGGKKKGAASPYRGGRDIFASSSGHHQHQHGLGRGGGADLDLGGAVLRKSKRGGDIFVDLGRVRDQKAILHVFQCNELKTDGYLYPSWLLLTASHAIKLRELRSTAREALVIWRRPLARLAKITAKKKHPTLLSFTFEMPTSGTRGAAEDELEEGREPPRAANESSSPSSSLKKLHDKWGQSPQPAAATTPEAEPPTPTFSIGGDDSPPPERKAFSHNSADGDTTTTAAAAAAAEVSAPNPLTPQPATPRTAAAAMATDSTTATPSSSSSAAAAAAAADGSDGAAAEIEKIVERFLVPEVQEAKAVLRDLIAAVRA